MKTFSMTLILLFAICNITSSFNNESIMSTSKFIGISDYLGQWTLDIQGGAVGWLEVSQEKGYLDGKLLWRGGSVNPVSNIYLNDANNLIVTQTNDVVQSRDENNNPVRTHSVTSWLDISRKGEKITGFLFTPRRNGLGVDSLFFTGTKLPDVPLPPDLTKLKYGKPIVLFNGKDLTGWKSLNPDNKNGFQVLNGVLVNDPVQAPGQPRVRYANLRTEAVFEDFNLKIEVNVPEGSNSGIYLRGMYEIQVLDSYNREPDSHNMGAVYSRITPSVKAEKPAGTWQTLDITLCKRHITVILNGVNIIDNKPVYGPTGGAIISDVFAPGPIYLQGDHGKVSFRNIILTPIL